MTTINHKAAMQQALEALELIANVSAMDYEYQRWAKTGLAALREALSEQQVDWKEEAMRLAGLNAKNVGELRKLEAEQAEQEPVAWRCTRNDISDINYADDAESLKYFERRNYDIEPLYAAPVRTKDLTDVDLWKLWEKSDSNIAFARAVIAADREKNK